MERTHRKELKHDELLEGTLTVWHQIEANPKPWLMGAGAIVGLVAVILGVRSFSSYQAGKTADLLARGQAALMAPIGGSDAPKPQDPYAPSYPTASDRARDAAQRLAAATGGWGTPSKAAEYLRGIALIEAGDAAGALSALEKADSQLAGDPTLGPLARAALAEAYGAVGQRDKALALLGKMAEDTSSWYPRDLALAAKAKLQEAGGMKAEARATWQQITDLFPSSSVAQEAKDATERLK